MSERNMSIWDKVCNTDGNYTKLVEFGKRKFTNVDAQWQLQKATELFGPYGRNWGLKELRFSHVPTGDSFTLVLEATMFYPSGEFPVAVDMPFRPNNDCYKKIVTSARKKALSYLGFSSDIYLGMFDDDSYVAKSKAIYGDMDVLKKKIVARIKMAKSLPDLKLITERLECMVADEQLDPTAGESMFELIQERANEFSGENE